MIRLEQVRGEMLERFERLDRRFAQNEQRFGRIEQRLGEIAECLERIERLREELSAQLALRPAAAADLTWVESLDLDPDQDGGADVSDDPPA
jgi:hypothetical protein